MMDIGDFNSDRIISFSDVIPRLILLGKTIHVEFYCSGRYFLVTASGLHWRIQGGGGDKAPGTRAPTSGSNFFHFYAILRKNLPNNRLTLPP